MVLAITRNPQECPKTGGGRFEGNPKEPLPVELLYPTTFLTFAERLD